MSTGLRDRCTMQCRVSVPSGARTDTRLPASSASRVRVRVVGGARVKVLSGVHP